MSTEQSPDAEYRAQAGMNGADQRADHGESGPRPDLPEGEAQARPNLARRAAMEAIGTFALVTAGCGAIVTNTTHPGSIGGVGISLVFGLVIMVMIYAGGHLSGAHYNPSVTVAFTLARHFPVREAAAYIAAQIAGATAAALLLLAAWPAKPAHLGTTLPSVGSASALLYEIVLTAFLMFVITAVATDTRAVGAAAAIAIGGTVGLDALFGGPITGASMNPARSLGPALVSDTWSSLWIYILGPLIGATVGVFAYELVRGPGRTSPSRAPIWPAGATGQGGGTVPDPLPGTTTAKAPLDGDGTVRLSA